MTPRRWECTHADGRVFVVYGEELAIAEQRLALLGTAMLAGCGPLRETTPATPDGEEENTG